MRFDKPCYIIGAGGHAKTLLDALRSRGADVTGCVDPAKKIGETVLGDITVLGGDAIIENLNPVTAYLFNGIGSVKTPDIRMSVFKKFTAMGFHFPPAIHARASISDFSTIGSGSVVQAGSVLQAGVTLGDNVIVNTQASIDHDCHIADHSHIAPGAILCGDVRIGNRTHIGAGATIIQNTTIGDDVIIGAGVVIKADVPSGSTIS